MNRARLLQVIVAQYISDKATTAADKRRQMTFKVLPDATKPEIKAAVEFLFSVKVECVQTLNVKGKRKNFGRVRGKRSDWKKAYVKLKEGHDITFGVDGW
jgi:large subunit ribosomal protein L23